VRYIINYIKVLLLIFGVEIHRSKSIRISGNKLFANRKLVNSDNGYWYVNPMPSNLELMQYYKSTYWHGRGGVANGINGRDLLHWNLIMDYLSLFFSKKKNILNFGAGGGGISHLFWLNNHNIINIEPSDPPKCYKERWNTYKSFDCIESNSIDFLYGSHSLEHVGNLEEFEKNIYRVMSKDSYIFLEVPNGNNPRNGAALNKIHVPHTYYFRKEYFSKFFKEILINDEFNQSHEFGIFDDWRDFKVQNGVVIRCLTKFSKD